mmetsp:Transcript_17701/g.43232  ORF Transcript_17701/g.43232 Transcript_17701/m.43232 type:complete len:204 (-) Transcript_17701:244-855(-)|eukprot:CAMPEP_0114490986 /NCGR_PEP_ID=MMETSP0109-20121206/2752_1 /TAXON_ID=29199 /ORGANISM="Chlorarachnion reptans, Strain CCCM449" /LENGTH=203 /DNA_ID=CAMNT_0001667675 /DNA_START=229 /DNA_END=840 /DNA_ORIENTATION=+
MARILLSLRAFRISPALALSATVTAFGAYKARYRPAIELPFGPSSSLAEPSSSQQGRREKKKKRCRACEDDDLLGDALKIMGSHFDGKKKVACPPNAGELGRGTWTYLHSLAAYYPDEPTEELQQRMISFLDTFAETYPCEYCAYHMREYLKTNPPEVETRRKFSIWMCEMHNDVNKRQGKPTFDCSKVDERWLDGPPDGSCD